MDKKNEASEKRIKELIKLLNKWNYEYYILNQPSVEDAVYDKHFRELQSLEKQFNFIFPDSPTQKIGSPPSLVKLAPVRRQNPMLSLDSIDNYEDLLKFDERVKKILKIEKEIEYVCEWKIDGLSVSLVYENNRLNQISTRGNGLMGEDITFNQGLIKNTPSFLPLVVKCEVRGEVYMKKTEFWRLNEELKNNNHKLLANPRNAAAGTLRTLIPAQNRNLHFFAYQLFNHDLPSQLVCLQQLEKLGFAVSPNYQSFVSIHQVWEFIQKQEKLRNDLDFESDGVVVKVNDYNFYPQLGQTSRFPRWAIAYKFPASVATSQVKDIVVEVSRSGRITYVAVIEPVLLLGSKISKVTLHNYAFIRSLKLNRGDEIVIKKAGDVIPQITQIIKSEHNFAWDPPLHCPSCNSKLEWNSTNIYQVCINENCSQKIINFLAHFASKTGVDIKGVSRKIIAKLFENNLLKSPGGFYQLNQKKEELLRLAGLEQKSVENMLSAIENSKQKPLANLLTALGIPLLSSVKTQKLIKFYPSLSSILAAVEKQEWEKFGEILGTETQKEIRNYFQKPLNRELVEKLREIWEN
ncbi:MAG: NAD-dependent DNA ligase LigA [Candidatus Moeniiplasma glomeromycotorum]|nr:NAD-dependent DNA ligase LigA [Candidatus Moeniiplasma glomeromycotorum]MCE8162441.1 NAD-dependent DNA ligase LigA [Candidatus Moeniiplasma glomeromycotorum]MCE8166367.1 NAD-dependent DNA ligase LigA [Candidatus Moeniiplasma glomeromycotorum]MCE8166849.1 NAD-dependent DNA ligase LigA [Candidatus Moeniiplasma glomeromycotorum]